MLSWLRPKLTNLFCGKPITESYLGKVVRVDWTNVSGDCESGSYTTDCHVFIVVLKDDNCRNIAGSIVKEGRVPSYFPEWFLSYKDQLHHATKRSVTIVADSVKSFLANEEEKGQRKQMIGAVCSNEDGVVGIVTAYRDHIFYGKTIEGLPWESKDPTHLATSYRDYTERKGVNNV